MESDNTSESAESDNGNEEGDGEEHSVILTEDDTSSDTDEDALRQASRLAYNTGHGDFCFSALEDWETKVDATNDKEKLWRMGISESNGGPFVELGGFQRYFYFLTFPFRGKLLTSFRSGPFPFFKLPLEVREIIYKLLLGPFYEYHESIKKSFISLCLTPDPGMAFAFNEKEELFEDELKLDSMNKRLDLGEITFEEYEIEEAEYYESKEKASRLRLASLPGRTGEYKLIAHPIREQSAGYKYRDREDWFLFEWVRQASNISVQFRKELGDVFWRRTRINVETLPRSFWILPEFLDERPAIHPGIKYLNLSITTWEEAPKHFSKAFEIWCDYVSDTLTLEKLHLDIILEKEDVKRVKSGKGMFACLASFRKLQVTRSFKLSVSIVGALGKKFELLAKECESQLQELMMPDTLRQSPIEEDLQSNEQEHPRSPYPMPCLDT
jgi:hypothetical protein